MISRMLTHLSPYYMAIPGPPTGPVQPCGTLYPSLPYGYSPCASALQLPIPPLSHCFSPSATWGFSLTQILQYGRSSHNSRFSQCSTIADHLQHFHMAIVPMLPGAVLPCGPLWLTLPNPMDIVPMFPRISSASVYYSTIAEPPKPLHMDIDPMFPDILSQALPYCY